MFKRWVVAGLLAVESAVAIAQQPPPSSPSLKCDIGPISRTFGGAEWIVYSCDDHASMVVLPKGANPPLQFHFFLSPDAGAYKIVSQGDGDRKVIDPAKDELSKFTSADFAALLAATKAASNKQ